MIKKILISFFISASIYLAISVTLTLLPVQRNLVENNLHFEALEKNFVNRGVEKHYTARDGNELFYRYYDSDSDKVLILLHGSGSEGRYLTQLAEKLSSANKAIVIVPDLRGHGQSIVTKPGDVAYLGQLEDDLLDLNKHLRVLNQEAIILLGAHSSGGGLAIKYAGKNKELQYDGYLLFAPYLGHDAPTTKPNSGGWVQVSVRRYVGLSMLNNIGITLLNHTPVLFFNRPSQWEDDLQVNSYSYRMNEAISPQDYALYLNQNKQPILVLVGLDDEAFYAEKYQPVFSEHAPHAHVEIIENAKHLDVFKSTKAYDVVTKWLNQFNT